MNFDELRVRRDAANDFTREVGIVTSLLEEGHAVNTLELRPWHRNPIGSVHGGCIYTMADAACGMAVASYLSMATTLDSSFNFLAPAMNESKVLTGDARVIKRGKNVLVCEVKITDDRGKLIASGSFTFFDMHRPLPNWASPEEREAARR